MFLDNFRRQDHGGFAKAMWTVLIIFLPVLGVLIYLIAARGLSRYVDAVVGGGVWSPRILRRAKIAMKR